MSWRDIKKAISIITWMEVLVGAEGGAGYSGAPRNLSALFDLLSGVVHAPSS
jgi:hypothetical protein